MSDEKDKAQPATFDLDWDDALADWERDVEDSAEARAKPMPQKPAVKAPSPPARALYQPPDPAEIARLRQQHASVLDEETEHTVLAPALRTTTSSTAEQERQTHRPPPMDVPASAKEPTPSGADMDLDDLLSGFEHDTRHYPAEIPKRSSPGSVAAPPREPSAPPTPAPPSLARPPLPPRPAAGAPPVPSPPRPRNPLLKPGAPPPPPPRPSLAGAPPAPPLPKPLTKAVPPPMVPPPVVPPPTASVASESAFPKEPGNEVITRPPPGAASAVGLEDDISIFEDSLRSSPPVATAPSARPAPRELARPPVAVSPSADVSDDELDALLGLAAEPLATPIAPQVSAPQVAPPTSLEDELDAALGLLDDAPVAPVALARAPEPAPSEDLDALLDDLAIGSPDPVSLASELEPSAERPLEEEPLAVVEASIEVGDEASIEVGDEASIEVGDEASIEVGDEASVEVGDEASIEVGDEASVEVGDADEAPPAPAVAAPTRPTMDRGAQAARRTVRSRKPRVEVFPLVGRQPAALAARAELLESIAATASGVAKARALAGAAELRWLAGDRGAASELVRASLDLDASDVATVRFARALAVAARDDVAIQRWLTREAELETVPREASARLATAAEVAAKAGRTVEAASLALRSWEADRSLVSALAMLAYEAVTDDVEEALHAFLASIPTDTSMELAARLAERALLAGRRFEHLEPDARLALAELITASSPTARAAAWETLAGQLGGIFADVARALAAREAMLVGVEPTLPKPSRLLAATLRRERAIAASDVAGELESTEGIAMWLGGAERALGLARAAMLEVSAGRHAEARALLERAQALDAGSAHVAAAKARLAELDPDARERLVASEGALAVAARLVRDAGAAEQEHTLLEQADGDDPVARTLRVDVAAARGDTTFLRSDEEPESLLFAAAALGDSDAAQSLAERSPTELAAHAAFVVAPDEATRSSRAELLYELAPTAAHARLAAVASRADDDAFAAWVERAADDEAAPSLLAELADRTGDSKHRARAIELLAGNAVSAQQDVELVAEASTTQGVAERFFEAAAQRAPSDPVVHAVRWTAARAAGAPTGEQGSALGVGLSGPVAGARVVAASLFAPETTVAGELEGVSAVVHATAQRRRDEGAASASLVAAPASIAEASSFAQLRALERARMEAFGAEGVTLDDVELAVAQALGASRDRVPALRLALGSSLRFPHSDEWERAWVELASELDDGFVDDLWLARRLATAAGHAGKPSLVARADLRIAELLTGAAERASMAVCSVEAEPSSGRPAAERLEILRAFAVAAPQHPLATERLAELMVEAGRARDAGPLFEDAARAAVAPARRARLFVRAADLYEEHDDDSTRVAHALEEAARADVSYPDVFDRLRALLERRGERERLAELVTRRLAAGGDGAAAVELQLAQASLREQSGDRAGACEALRAALEQAPEHLGALKKLAQLSLADEDYRGAAEALIRLAKLRREAEELRWVFYQLGEIYHRHIPDPKRAEAAYKRALKLVPSDLSALERLAELYVRERQHALAIESYDQLLKSELEPDTVRRYRLLLARVYEESGDARRAEQALETTRRAGPTDLETLRALADFYGRQKAQTALAMHLNRAAQDFRHALQSDITDEAAWLGLVEVLGWRGRHDAACAAASVAVAMGLVDVEVAKLVDAQGGAPAVTDVLRLPEVEEAIAPSVLSPAARQALALIGPYIDKALGFDPRNYRGEKLPPRDPATIKLTQDVSEWLGVTEVEVWLAPTSPRVCLPFGSTPAGVLLGREVLSAPESERQFLMTRALFIAKHGLAGVLRATQAEVSAMLAYVAQQFDAAFTPIGLDPGLVQEQGRRLAKHAPRKVIEDAGPLVYEMVGAAEYEPAKLAMAASELGDRVALLATGSMPAALQALLKLAGEPAQSTDLTGRAASLRRSPEAMSLVSFAVSEPHFEARRRSAHVR